MTKKSTKRALISSLLILAMCFTMLVGTTFAWFTDSVTGNNNRIVAGKLQIGAYGGADYNTSITAINDLFIAPDSAQKGLWEPGHVEVAYLKIVNEGTLALKYKVTASTANEVVGKNAAGEDIKLSEILDVAVVESDSAISYSTRDAALAAITTTSKLGQLSGVSEYSLAVGAEKYVAVIVSMATTVGNEANYRSTDIPSIDFAVSVLATQDTVENDSFNNLYDILATVDASAANATELAAAIAAADPGDVIEITAPITDDTVVIDKDITIVGNGKEIKANIKSGDVKLVDVDSKYVKVDNAFDGTLEFDGGTLSMIPAASGADSDAPFSAKAANGTFIFKDMTVTAGSTKGIKISKAKEVIIENCTFDAYNMDINATAAQGQTPYVTRSLSMIDIQEQNTAAAGQMAVTIKNCTFIGAPQGATVGNYKDTDTAGAIKLKAEEQGFSSVTITGNTFTNCYRDVAVGVNVLISNNAWVGIKNPNGLTDAKNNVADTSIWHISGNTTNGDATHGFLIASNGTKAFSDTVGEEIGGATVYYTYKTAKITAGMSIADVNAAIEQYAVVA